MYMALRGTMQTPERLLWKTRSPENHRQKGDLDVKEIVVQRVHTFEKPKIRP